MSNDPFSTSNDFSPPQPNFGDPVGNPPQKRGGLLGIFGGVTAVGCFALLGAVVLCCVCCVGAVVVAGRSPTGATTFWLGAASSGNWDFAENFICEGSQAQRLTAQYATTSATFTSFNANSAAGDTVQVTGVVTVNGNNEDWDATFITAEGGTLGRCVEQIIVENDPILGNNRQ